MILNSSNKKQFQAKNSFQLFFRFLLLLKNNYLVNNISHHIHTFPFSMNPFNQEILQDIQFSDAPAFFFYDPFEILQGYCRDSIFVRLYLQLNNSYQLLFKSTILHLYIIICTILLVNILYYIYYYSVQACDVICFTDDLEGFGIRAFSSMDGDFLLSNDYDKNIMSLVFL